jgi:hypothetical protein
MSKQPSLKELAASMGYADENYLIWIKAWLTEPILLQVWSDYLEGQKTNRNPSRDKQNLVELVTAALESKEGSVLAHYSTLTLNGVEARFAVRFVWGCQTKHWLWKGWMYNKKSM